MGASRDAWRDTPKGLELNRDYFDRLVERERQIKRDEPDELKHKYRLHIGG
jgi:hypothetical protein